MRIADALIELVKDVRYSIRMLVKTAGFTTVAVAGLDLRGVQPYLDPMVNVAVAGDTMDWKCYRYRVFETIVPIRNAQWRP